MMSYSAFCQNPLYSTIAKNINPDGLSLHHDLNAAGDTLHLKSDYKLYKVEFIGKDDAKTFMIEGNKSEAFIPLASVPVGEYTIAGFQIERSDDIYQYQKTIIFRVSRLLPIPKPFEEEENFIAEVTPEIADDRPIIEEETKVAMLEKPEPTKKKKLKTQPTPKKKTRIASTGDSSATSFVESSKKARENKLVRKTPDKKSRMVETKEPRLDTTEYKSYNLSTQRGGRYVVQSRAEYRSQNLRPNGNPYD
jgi:hypothetical protein